MTIIMKMDVADREKMRRKKMRRKKMRRKRLCVSEDKRETVIEKEREVEKER